MIKIIQDFINVGQYSKAISLIDSLTGDEGLEGRIYLSMIFREQGKYPEALETIDDVIKHAEVNYRLKLIYKAYIEKIYILYRLDHLQDALDLAIEIKELEVSLSLNFEFRVEKMTLYTILGNIYYKKSLNEKAFENFSKSLQIAEDVGDKNLIAQAHNSLFTVYNKIGFYKKGENHLQLCLENAKAVNNLKYQIYSYINLGELSRMQGSYKKALDFYKKSLKLNKNIIESAITITYNNIGMTYFKLNDFINAEKYLINSLSRFRNLESKGSVIETLFYLLLISLERKDVIAAESYLDEFSNIKENKGDKTYELRKKIAEAVYLLHLDGKENRDIARTKLEKVVARDFIDVEYNILAIIYLCNVYLDDYQTNNDEIFLLQAEQLIDKLFNIADELNAIHVQIESLVLKAKLAIIKSEVHRVDKLLEKAHILSKEIDLGIITSDLNLDHARIIDKLASDSKISFPIAAEHQRQQLLKLANLVSDLIKNNLDTDLRTMYDIPLKFSIYNHYGDELYEYVFPGFDENHSSIDALLLQLLPKRGNIFDFTYKNRKIKYLVNNDIVFCCYFMGNTCATYTKMMSLYFQIQNILPGTSFVKKLQNIDLKGKNLVDGVVRGIFQKVFPTNIIGSGQDNHQEIELSEDIYNRLIGILQLGNMIGINTLIEQIQPSENINSINILSVVDLQDYIERGILIQSNGYLSITDLGLYIREQIINIQSILF